MMDYLLSITPMDITHIDEICDDLKQQYETGVMTHAMLTMYFAPVGDPAQQRAEYYCKLYDQFHEKLEKLGVPHGVLVQSTLGHGAKLDNDNSFQKVIPLSGSGFEYKTCPLDKDFQKYIKEQMRILASRNPEIILIDDDMGLMYGPANGCCCPLHMEEFKKLSNTSKSPQDIIAHINGNSDEDKYYTDLYVKVQEDSLVKIAEVMRDGIDEVNPSIKGAISLVKNYCEASEGVISAFSGKGNVKIARFNNGNYTAAGPRFFTKNMTRAAHNKFRLKNVMDFFLAETDTCPQNRYSTSASMLHAHMTGSILEGAKGAKHWITRMREYAPESGVAYRKILAKYRGFYDELSNLVESLKPVGLRFPLSKVKNYELSQDYVETVDSPWVSYVMERLGLPVYFSGDNGGTVLFDDDAPSKFTDEEIKCFFEGTIILSAKAAKAVNERFFKDYTGVDILPWNGKKPSFERIAVTGESIGVQVGVHKIVPLNDNVLIDSRVFNIPDIDKEVYLFPGSTIYNNPLGGTTVVFSGTPDTKFNYMEAFSFLCSSRKKQFINILSKTSDLPVYYPGDLDIYMRAGYIDSDRLLCVMFNISLDMLEEITLVLDRNFSKIEMIMPDGSYKECDYKITDGVVHILESINVLEAIALIISY